MKHATRIALVLAWCLPLTLMAAEDDPAAARRLFLSGKYAEAAEIYGRLAPEDPSATLGLARALAAEGKLKEAVKTLTSGAGEHADLHAELARLAFDRGDYKAAHTHVGTALRLDTNQLLARWIRGELLRTSGKLQEAEDAYHWLVRFYNAHQPKIKRAESLRWIGLAAARYARWNRISGQFDFLVNELYPDAIELEPDYWPAHYESGLLFLEKYNRADAAAELKSALKLNANAPEVHVALARLALLNREIDKAQASLERALEINPSTFGAWLVMADLAWANFQPQEAIRLLEKHALALNPVSEEALGRLAACYVVLDGVPEEGKHTRLTRLVDQVARRNEHAGEFFFTLAAWLEDRHKIPEAEEFFHEAIRRMPQLIGPKAQLGMMYMDAAQEAKARTLLEEAFEADPFNVRVDNMLKVLDVLDGMETRQTEHCLLKFDADRDQLLARYAARYLDAVYLELCNKFGYRPSDPPLVEMFNQARGVNGRQWFSTRMIGLPYLGVVAASTGKMVGMVSPGEPSMQRRFNWAQVLRHEMVHVITLQQTHFNVPHWYTEGLAVWCEETPRPPTWNRLLAARVPKGDMFNLQTLNFGFTRPGSSDDWHMAYCQAELYVDYMLEGRSPDVLRELLAAYAENLTTDKAIPRVFGVSQEQFEQGYLEYVKKVVVGLSGVKRGPSESFADLLAAHRKKPDDPDLAARVAYGYLGRGADREARELAEKVLKLDPKHPLANYVVARLHVQAGQTQQAVDLLEACLDRQHPHPLTLNLLAGLKLKAEEYAEAAELYLLGARHDPHNLKWLQALARVYLKSKNDRKLAEVLTRLARADPDDLASRKKLAQMALAGGDFASAAEWANQALHVDVTDADVHRMFAEALVGRHNYPGAIEEFEATVELDPKAPQPRMALAKVYLQAGKTSEARRALEGLLRLDPNHVEAGKLLEELEEKEEL